MAGNAVESLPSHRADRVWAIRAMRMQALPRLSLIVATLSRVAELARYLASLAAQSNREFEVVLVDQNNDDRVAEVVARHGPQLSLTRVCSPPGLSRARNAGLQSARGAIVGFPDDDCWYDADIVARVLEFFAGRPAVDGLSGGGAAGAGGPPRARFARSDRWVSAARVWTQGMSSAIFLRRELIAAVGPFDEQLGVGSGTAWPAAEETDYLLRAIASGARIWYDSGFTVRHPGTSGQSAQQLLDRGAAYGRAMGYVLAKHRRSRVELAYHVGRAVAGATLAAARARRDETKVYAAIAQGRLRGWRDGVALRAGAPATGPHRHSSSDVEQPT